MLVEVQGIGLIQARQISVQVGIRSAMNNSVGTQVLTSKHCVNYRFETD